MKLVRQILLALTFAFSAVSGAFAEGKTHYIVFHVDQNDPKVMNITLNNVQNVRKYYESKGDKVVIEIVAYGPGLMMYIPGKSPVEKRIETLALEADDITFSACGNTKRKIEKKTGQPVKLMEEARVVPSGVVRIVELQEQGYAYVRP